MTTALAPLTWSLADLGPALEALAAAAGLATGGRRSPSPPPATAAFDQALVEAAGRGLGLEVEEVEVRYHEVTRFLTTGGPALFPVDTESGPRLVALLAAGRGARVRLLGPDLRAHRVPLEAVRAALAAPLEGPATPRIDEILAQAGVARRRRGTSRKALLEELLGARPVARCSILRQQPGSSFRDQVVAARQVTGGLALAACHLLQTTLFLTAWWLVGRGAMAGNLDRAWLAGWALILLTLVPLRMLTVSLQGQLVIGVACLLKRRLLDGVLRLDLEKTKLEGVGMQLGRVLEANALEALMLGAGLRAVLATVDLAVTVWVLAHGAGGGWHAALFVLWTGLTVLMVRRLWLGIDGWTSARLRLTHDLAERLVGHRTRLAQQPATAWHEGEDELLDAYVQASLAMDRVTPWLAQATFGWRVVGLLGLALPFVAGTGTPVGLAVAIGGVLLGAQSLAGFTVGVHAIGLAAIAWRRVAPVFHAAADGAANAAGLPSAPVEPGGAGTIVVAARDVGFTYQGRGRPALTGIDLAVRGGDRLLLVGPSGGGKSTLVALLSALRQPDTGLILCRGLDLATMGAATWRRTVATAPQFHDNHVLSETFAFNLLMGRRWPPHGEDLHEAELLCRELGLGDLLDRMPSGMMQMVGDTGWQLSHGEQSRLFVARALLQDADLVILDESFGALDPVNLKRAIDCAWRRARTLMVIAHP